MNKVLRKGKEVERSRKEERRVILKRTKMSEQEMVYRRSFTGRNLLHSTREAVTEWAEGEGWDWSLLQQLQLQEEWSQLVLQPLAKAQSEC